MQMKTNLLFLIIQQISKKERKIWSLFSLVMLWRKTYFSVIPAVDKMDDCIISSSPVVSVCNFLYYYVALLITY